MPNTWNPFSGDFWTEENWWGSQGQKPWQIDPNSKAYGTGVPGQNMQAMLEQQARGEGPSLGRGMMQEGLAAKSIKNQRAQASGMMGTNPALAMKLSGQQAGEATAQNLRDVGQVGLQEQMQAQQALQQWIQQERAAQMMLDQQRMNQRNLYQQRLWAGILQLRGSGPDILWRQLVLVLGWLRWAVHRAMCPVVDGMGRGGSGQQGISPNIRIGDFRG